MIDTLNCNGKILSLKNPLVMGIINTTPDSFYASSRIMDPDAAIRQADKMLNQGAAIIDIGAMSSRPGSELIPVEMELKRVLTVLKPLRKEFPNSFISIDTFRAEVAKQTLDEGADIINDISAGSLDAGILDVVADQKVPYIFMHMQGVPKTMQDNPQYEDVVSHILKYMFDKIRYFRSKGIEQLIADPGFGFGKSLDDNYRLLDKLEVFNIIGIPVMVGISRKSMLYKLLDTTAEDSLNATTAAHVIALQKGAKILRAHDVREAVEVVKIVERIV
jgi:dihydropteroate synthase